MFSIPPPSKSPNGINLFSDSVHDNASGPQSSPENMGTNQKSYSLDSPLTQMLSNDSEVSSEAYTKSNERKLELLETPLTRIMHDGKAIQQYGDGSSERDYTHIDDILKGVLGRL